jgi:16S rRNA (cytosine1402-N4)-methyltransferase
MDATIGTGGHAEEILKNMASGGKLIGIDRDNEAIKMAEKRMVDKRLILRLGNFSDMENILYKEGLSEVDGILFDLGISMAQLKDYERGFSFHSDQSLDMRMDRRQALSAWDVVNTYPEKKLEQILREFGEEPLAKKIAKAIVIRRASKLINTCSELSGIVNDVYRRRKKIHPATKTFQALRVEVNGELEQLKEGLNSSLRLLRKNGRLCVISYHSLEDRIVKHFFVDRSKNELFKVVTKKPIRPKPEELRTNPSSRSAKLRVAERI